jgi:pimeloyl-ACP methyl ester carboxylesterase
LIPGLNSDNASWYTVCARLARHFRVILFDNRACGRSDTPRKKYSIREMADDARGLLDRLRIKKCHVIGHSMGGYIAQELAARYPGCVDKLVLEATAPASSKRNNRLFRGFLRRFEKGRDKKALMRSWLPWSFSAKTLARKNYIASFVKKAAAYPYFQSAEGFRSQIEAVARFDCRARLKKIKAKTLVIIGSDDALIYPRESLKLARGIKGSVVAQVRGAGHCLHVEKPSVFASVVIKFLKK